MTRHGEEFNEFHTRYHSIATYDMVQDSLALTFSFIIALPSAGLTTLWWGNYDIGLSPQPGSMGS